MSEGFAGNLTVGHYDVFSDSFTIGVELGYRMWLQSPKVEFQSGTYLEKHENSLESHGKNSINIVLTVGWIF